MKLIYISGPYRADQPWQVDINIAKAEAAQAKFLREGWAVICPHKMTSQMERYPEFGPRTFLDSDMEILKRCDAIFMMKGWYWSEGAQEEFWIAQKHDLEVIHECDEAHHIETGG